VEWLQETVPWSSLLRRLLDASGGNPISLRDVITAGLYDPDDGYYTKNIRTVGIRGDFTTTPQLSKRLGQSVANWLRRQRKSVCSSARCNFFELGAGTGELMRQVMKNLGMFSRWRWHFSVVDISGPLKNIQKKTLGDSVKIYPDLVSALAEAGGRGLILGNEFADAFPPTVAQLHEGKWHELMLAQDADGVARFCLGDREFADYADFFPAAREGQRIEVPRDFCEWLKCTRSFLKRAIILLIDYGGTTEEIYAKRKHGTLRSYSFHQRIDGACALARLGKCDITCDVDFSYVARQAASAGYQVGPLKTLSAFFSEHLRHDGGLEEEPALHVIGETFRCLELRAC